MRPLLKYLKNYRLQLVLGPVFKLLEAVFELIVPVVMADIIDNGVANHDSAYIWRKTGIIVLLGVCGLGFAVTCQFLASRCAYGFGRELRDALYRHICSLSYESVDRFGAASLVNRLTNDTNTVQNGVNMFIRLATRSPFLVIGAAVMAVTIDLRLSVIFFIAAPLISGVIFVIMRKTVPMYKTAQQKLDRAATLTRESIEGSRVIRAFSRQGLECSVFDRSVDELTIASESVGRISAILNPFSFLIMDCGIAAILWFGGERIDTGSLTQGELTAFTNYMTQILLALVVLANLIVTFTKAFASANRISEVFAVEPESSGTDVPGSVQPGDEILRFNDVSFTYKGGGDCSLKNISFSLKKGGFLGIIGGTGSGKSTVAQLIPGFYEPQSGEVIYGGKDVKTLDKAMLRRRIGWVAQRAVLFSGSVRENMRFRCPDASDEDIIKALKTAQAWDFVEKMPDGLDSRIAQGGRNLSGGQRQRIAIARALVGSPEVLILDDSTSALDYATDLRLRRALSEELPETSVVMISQRTTSIKDADCILVLDEGSPAGVGTHDELLRDCAVYREIFNSQMNEKGGGGNG
ncbi:MAG: ABC transporter ATP-binding protein [Ruminococcus sp.]|nr:ABC transporter ATP-binding protein [Ruminococcus sp.]